MAAAARARPGGGRYDVAVVGAGAVGAAVGYFLARAGLRAVLLERDRIAAGASGTAPGAINPLHGPGIPGPLEPWAREAFRLHLELWKLIEEQSGTSFAARVQPRVHLARREDELAALAELFARCERSDGFTARWLDAGDVRSLDPRISGEVIGGLWTDGSGALDSERYVRALAGAGARLGLTIRFAEVRGLRVRRQRVEAVLTGDRAVECDAVVVATGPWAGDLERWCGVRVPVTPVKGQVLHLRMPAPPVAFDLVFPDISFYVRKEGELWVGGTIEDVGFDLAPTPEARADLMSRASRVMPCLSTAEVMAQTACLRPTTADGLPLLGRVPGWDNLYLATGAGGKGMLLSTVMGRTIADLVLAAS
jgi:glycine oxidase